MRADKRDIVEIFGYAPDDVSDDAMIPWRSKNCPFIGTACDKAITRKNNSSSTNVVICGVCAVSNGIQKNKQNHVIVCPKRLYASDYKLIRVCAEHVWPDVPVLIGGTLSELKDKAKNLSEVVIAFGHNSGREIQITAEGGSLSMDWVLQRYKRNSSGVLLPLDFIGIEVQSIDTTGSYAHTWQSYEGIRQGNQPSKIEASTHGLNWANVHKRILPQLLRKGNIYKDSTSCRGFFFLVPKIVYAKFSTLLGELPPQQKFNKDNLSIIQASLGDEELPGVHRKIENEVPIHFALEDIADAFVNRPDSKGVKSLSEKLTSILGGK